MYQSLKNQKGTGLFEVILIVAVLALIGFAGYRYFTAQKTQPVLTAATMEDTLKQEAEKYAESKSKITILTDRDPGVHWHKDGYYYSLGKGFTVVISETDVDAKKINSFTSDLDNLVKSVLEKNGFKPEAESTFKNAARHQTGFIKGDVHCAGLYITSESDPFDYNIVCFDDQELKLARTDQEPILKGFPKGTIIGNIKRSKIDPNFVSFGNGDISSFGGAHTIAKKVGSIYVEVISLQNTPPCDMVDGKGIPKDMMAECSENDELRPLR